MTFKAAIPILCLLSFWPNSSWAKMLGAVEIAQKTAENQIRRLLEPLLDKYCHDSCKLMNVSVAVDMARPMEFAPGFDDLDIKNTTEIVPSTGRAKILIDDKVGPVSRSKLLDLVQQYLDTLDYPIKLETQIAHFPMPQGSEGKIAELRERVAKKFLGTTEDLLHQFCPTQCLIADFDLDTAAVNGEEAQYGSPGEYVQDGDTAIRIRNISASLLMDKDLSPEEQSNILEMVKLKTNSFKNVAITGKTLKFPKPLLAGEGGGSGTGAGASRSLASNQKTDSKNSSSSQSTSDNTTESKSDSKAVQNNSTTTADSNTKQEKFERIEKIERVENGDAVQAELQKFKVFGLIFACSAIALLIFIAVAGFRSSGGSSTVHRIVQNLGYDPAGGYDSVASESDAPAPSEDKNQLVSKRYEIERLQEELTMIYGHQPKVAKQVFSRVLTEEGIEFTADCIHIFGEGIVVEMLRDPSLQTDINELMEFYAKNPINLNDDQKLEILRKLHARTIAGKLVVLGNRSSNLFDFLAEMDGLQILELIRTESLTVKSIILTQCDSQKRSAVYSQLDPETRMKLLTELSRIDYLPRDFIFNVANALKRKRKDNPRLNTEALPGSEVLVSLLERTGQALQKTVVKSLELTNPDSARTVKGKLVSVDTLRYLRDGQLLEVILNLKHEELLQFLKGAPEDIRSVIFSKSPKELVVELEEELEQVKSFSRESYQAVERKIINRMKVMANEGIINLVETNERMFADNASGSPFVESTPAGSGQIKKVGGW